MPRETLCYGGSYIGRPFAGRRRIVGPSRRPQCCQWLSVRLRVFQSVRSEDYFTLSSPMTGHMNKFALLCQAARLLGQVLRNVSSDSALHDNIWIQPDRTLQSMLAASLDVEVPDNDQIAFVYRYVLFIRLQTLLTT